MITKQGTVVKKSGDKTVKVEIRERRQHPKYQKSFPVTKKFLVHDENNAAKEGDQVTIVQSRPKSKRKSWALAA